MQHYIPTVRYNLFFPMYALPGTVMIGIYPIQILMIAA